MSFMLRFDRHMAGHWAGRYDEDLTPVERTAENHILGEIVPRARAVGFLSHAHFFELCCWKSPRSKRRCLMNTEQFVEEVTRVALSTPSEQLRIEALTLLSGVGWPTASVILHFCHREPYPILDFRALWSLGMDSRPDAYDFQFWWGYTLHCRGLAQELGTDMRTLDKALWQYSKENQASWDY
jgi:hypothetical protein